MAGSRKAAATRLTPELQASIVADINAGLFFVDVGINNGVHPDTIKQWVSWGLEENAEEPFASFAEAYGKAEVGVKKQCLAVIRQGAENKKFRKTKKVIQAAKDSPETTIETAYLRGDWRAAAWYAEKRWPTQFGSVAPNYLARNDMGITQLLEEAQTRNQSLAELLANPPPELEEALLAAKDQILEFLTNAPKKLT